MFKLVCLRLLFLFIATVFAIPVQNKDQNPRSHREQSQELDETIDWAGLEPIVELPISNPSAHQVTSSIPPKQTTASSLVIATSLDKNMLKRKRVVSYFYNAKWEENSDGPSPELLQSSRTSWRR